MQAGVALPANRRRLSVFSGYLSSLEQTSVVFNCLQQGHTLNLMGHSVRLRRFFRMDVLLIASVLSTAYIATALPIAFARPIFSRLSRPSVFTEPRALFVQPMLSMASRLPCPSCPRALLTLRALSTYRALGILAVFSGVRVVGWSAHRSDCHPAA
jgi:hypothetical protein